MTLSGVRRLGIFGGAFDPPHNGHVALARAAIDALQLDCLLVIPTGQAWHKPRQLSDARHRLAMCNLAFGDLGPVKVDSRETLRNGPTYTVDTLLELEQQYPAAQRYLLLGEDQARALPTWHRAVEVARLAIICIAMREQGAGSDGPAPPGGALPAGAQRIPMPPHAASATAIRARVACGDGAGPMVPPAVARYIEDNHLYKTH